MISMQNTANLTGVSIRGDYYDSRSLVESFHDIAIDEYADKNQEYIDVSTRLLGICYDIRHAYQGDREILLTENGMDESTMKSRGIITSKQNVYFQCNCLYPEMVYATIAINALIRIRMTKLTKKVQLDYDAYYNKNVIWDTTIITLRSFQSAFANCVREILSPNQYSRWLNHVSSRYCRIDMLALQYLDFINISYLHMTRDKRLKLFNQYSKRIVDFQYDDEHMEIDQIVTEAAKEYNSPKSQIGFEGVEYPEIVEW